MNYNFTMGVRKSPLISRNLARVAASILFFATADAFAALKLEATPSEVKDGGVVRITIQETEPNSSGAQIPKTLTFADKEYPVYPVGPQKYEALVGVPFGYKKGRATAVLSNQSVEFAVVDAKYPSERLKVNPKHVKLKKRDLARVQREQKEIGALYQKILEQKLWSSNFALPINSPVTSVFGSKRLYNGQMQNFHQGLDLKAPTGTPIRAPERGRVAYVKDLFMTGNTVILDHGYGLFTVYAHMSKVSVTVGQTVEPGTELGLSGATGRASGPHLHWGAVINRVKVNPMDLTQVLAQQPSNSGVSKQ